MPASRGCAGPPAPVINLLSWTCWAVQVWPRRLVMCPRVCERAALRPRRCASSQCSATRRACAQVPPTSAKSHRPRRQRFAKVAVSPPANAQCECGQAATRASPARAQDGRPAVQALAVPAGARRGGRRVLRHAVRLHGARDLRPRLRAQQLLRPVRATCSSCGKSALRARAPPRAA